MNYIRGRHQVIYLTLISTVAAVGTVVIGLHELALLFAVISIALPIIASYLMNDLIRFTGTTAWIKVSLHRRNNAHAPFPLPDAGRAVLR